MVVTQPPLQRPDISQQVRDMLNRRESLAPQQIKEKAHEYASALAHAQSIDHQNGSTGKPDSNVARLKREIYEECKKSPEFKKEWESTLKDMNETYYAMREQNVYVGGEPGKAPLDPIALEKAQKLAELEKLLGHMKDAHKG